MVTTQYYHDFWVREYKLLRFLNVIYLFFTFSDTAGIGHRFYDAWRIVSPIYYFSYTGSLCRHLGAVTLTLTSFPISALMQEKNEVLYRLVGAAATLSE